MASEVLLGFTILITHSDQYVRDGGREDSNFQYHFHRTFDFRSSQFDKCFLLHQLISFFNTIVLNMQFIGYAGWAWCKIFDTCTTHGQRSCPLHDSSDNHRWENDYPGHVTWGLTNLMLPYYPEANIWRDSIECSQIFCYIIGWPMLCSSTGPLPQF